MISRLVAFVIAGTALVPGPALAAEPDLTTRCAQVGNDDTIRPFEPSLRAGLLQAYARLFPNARTSPDETQLKAAANIRCMDGRLLACFTGANLPCAKLNTERISIGADSYCRRNPNAAVVPAFAVGHDAAFAYRCIAGRPAITHRTFPLDARGFAATLWTPIDEWPTNR